LGRQAEYISKAMLRHGDSVAKNTTHRLSNMQSLHYQLKD